MESNKDRIYRVLSGLCCPLLLQHMRTVSGKAESIPHFPESIVRSLNTLAEQGDCQFSRKCPDGRGRSCTAHDSSSRVTAPAWTEEHKKNKGIWNLAKRKADEKKDD